jgi:uncharacterized coiled-coil protein SlyX
MHSCLGSARVNRGRSRPLFGPTGKRKLQAMNSPSVNPLEHLAARVTTLEESLTYCERMLDDLDQVMRDFQKRLTALDDRLTRLNKQLGFIADAISEGGRPPVDE